jgi:hypothetical protein
VLHIKYLLTILFQDVEVGVLNCNVKWEISEKLKVSDIEHIPCMFCHEQKLGRGGRDVKRLGAIERHENQTGNEGILGVLKVKASQRIE